MSITVRSMEDAALLADENFQEWQAKFEAQFYGPEMELMMAAMWHSMPPEVKAQLLLMNPDAYQKVEKVFSAGADRRGG